MICEEVNRAAKKAGKQSPTEAIQDSIAWKVIAPVHTTLEQGQTVTENRRML